MDLQCTNVFAWSKYIHRVRTPYIIHTRMHAKRDCNHQYTCIEMSICLFATKNRKIVQCFYFSSLSLRRAKTIISIGHINYFHKKNVVFFSINCKDTIYIQSFLFIDSRFIILIYSTTNFFISKCNEVIVIRSYHIFVILFFFYTHRL